MDQFNIGSEEIEEEERVEMLPLAIAAASSPPIRMLLAAFPSRPPASSPSFRAAVITPYRRKLRAPSPPSFEPSSPSLAATARAGVFGCPASEEVGSRGCVAGDEAEPDEEVQRSVGVLKKAAKTRRVDPLRVLEALRSLEKAGMDGSRFLQTIGGSQSPGRTWMLVFVSSADRMREALRGGRGGGRYFPVTAVQRFDGAAMRIENGIYLGPLGYLTFEGKFSWLKKRILAFIFEYINLKIGLLGPFKFKICKEEDEKRIPTMKDPFFTWIYADEEIIVGRGREGIAMWCRCTRVSPM